MDAIHDPVVWGMSALGLVLIIAAIIDRYGLLEPRSKGDQSEHREGS